MPLLAVLVPALAALLIAYTGERRANLREFWSVAAGVVMAALVACMIPHVLAEGGTPKCTLFKILPGIDLAFRADAFGVLFALGASLLWIVTSVYSIGYMRSLNEHAQTRYFACFALALSATVGVAFSANLFTLFLFYEALTLVMCKRLARSLSWSGRLDLLVQRGFCRTDLPTSGEDAVCYPRSSHISSSPRRWPDRTRHDRWHG